MLARLLLEGAIFLRGEYTEAWAYESMSSADVAAVLAPGPARVLLFHVIAPALAAIHAAPDERFRDVLGLAPIRYLTGWRMHLAEDLLRSSDLSLAAVARRVGYEAEEAFSRAFKRTHGEAPSVWRVRRASSVS